MKLEEMYLQATYSQIKDIVSRYNQRVSKQLEPQVPSNKKRTIKKIKNGERFIRFFQKEEDIPNEFFSKYFDLANFDEYIKLEVDKYVQTLGIGYTVGEIDISDLVSNPKTNGMTYIESLNRLYDKTDSVDYKERTFSRHMLNLSRYWLVYNESRMCLWDSYFCKIGRKYYISNSNGSHLTCLCKLMLLSGLNDKELLMPNGFVQSLRCIRTVYKNTPDDLEFVLMFNKMCELMKSINPSVKFYLKDDKTRGINIIGVEGTDIEFSSVQGLIEYMKVQPVLNANATKCQDAAVQSVDFLPKIVTEH